MRFSHLVYVLCTVFVNIQAEDCTTAKRWGFICLDERTSATCIESNGVWITLGGQNCIDQENNNFYCNMEFKNCSTAPASFDNFQCPGTGTYPNLWNCGNYYLCYNHNNAAITRISLECPAGTAFSTETNCCSEKQTDQFCARRKVTCNYLGEVAILPGTDNYFYYCHIPYGYNYLYPQLTKCPENQIFRNYQCTNGTSSSGTNPSSSACTVGAYSKDPNNCRNYYYCNIKGVLTNYSCGLTARFDEISKKCKLGNC